MNARDDGGNGPDEGHGIATDPAGNAYVTGHTFSPNFPTANALQAKLGGNGTRDAFVAKVALRPSVAELLIGPTLLLVVVGGAVGAWWWARGSANKQARDRERRTCKAKRDNARV